MPTATDLAEVAARLVRFEGRSPTTTDAELASAFIEVDQLGKAGIYVTSFSGRSEWERHQSGDELVQVLEGQAALTIMANPPVTVELRAGCLTVVPRGCWHRFDAPSGVSLVTVTPPPTDHHRDEAPPEATSRARSGVATSSR